MINHKKMSVSEREKLTIEINSYPLMMANQLSSFGQETRNANKNKIRVSEGKSDGFKDKVHNVGKSPWRFTCVQL
jgi:hypothetical protein